MTSKPSLRTSVALALTTIATLLTAAPATAAPPQVVFVGDDPAMNESQSAVFVANLDGTGRRRITSRHGVETEPDVSPDGTQVAYGSSDGIWIAELDGSAPRRVASGGYPAFSPDGRLLAYTAGVFDAEGNWTGSEVRVVSVTGTGDRRVTSGYDASWSPDGSRLVYAIGEGYGFRTGGLETVAIDGSDRRRLLTVEEHSLASPRWSPDGREIVYTDHVVDVLEGAVVAVVSVGTRAVRKLVDGHALGVDWSDDGSTVVFDRYRYDNASPRIFRLFSVARDGSGERPLLEGIQGSDPVFVGNAPGSVPAEAGFDGDPVTTERLDASSPTAAAIAASRRSWSDEHGAVAPEVSEPALPRATYAVLSRIDTFADSLAGAALTFRGPLLYTTTGQLTAETRTELARILGPRGLVYVLGGDRAISPAVVATLQADGYTVRRLAGPSRVETAIAVADEVRAQFPNFRRVLLARADGPGTAAWADSVTGGAFAADARIPLLLTPTDQLHPAVRSWMDRTKPSQTLLLGGPSALSGRVEAAVPSPVRLSGAARDGTAADVARRLWKVDPSGTRRYTVINGYAADGWAWGLASAGLADRADAPLLMVHPDTMPSATAQAVTGCRQVDLLVVGDTTTVAPARIDELDRLDTRC